MPHWFGGRGIDQLANRPDMIGIPIAIAGVIRTLSWTRHRLKCATYRLTAATWFASFFEKPLVNRVNRREAILTLRLPARRRTYRPGAALR